MVVDPSTLQIAAVADLVVVDCFVVMAVIEIVKIIVGLVKRQMHRIPADRDFLTDRILDFMVDHQLQSKVESIVLLRFGKLLCTYFSGEIVVGEMGTANVGRVLHLLMGGMRSAGHLAAIEAFMGWHQT